MTTETGKTQDIHWDEDVDTLRGLVRESLRDPRVVNYFDRGRVKSEDVLPIIDDDNVYTECRATDAFKAYAAKREEFDTLRERRAALEAAGSLNWKTVLIALAASATSSATLFMAYESGNKFSLALKVLLAIFSALAGCAAAWILGLCIRSRHLTSFLSLTAFALLGLSACSIALPLAFSLFPWNPVWLYANLGGALAAGALLSDGKNARDSRDLAKTVAQAIWCLLERQERGKRERAWIDDSLSKVIYPKVVLAINSVLGENSMKLLVEQNSDGLRRLQDPALTVPTKSEIRLRSLLDQLDGGSIAVTGPRGAGKTTLLRRMSGGPRGNPKKGQLSVYISAPAEYNAREFLAVLFQRVCDAYLRRHDSPVAGMRYRGLRTRRDTMRAMRWAVAVVRFSFRVVLILGLLALAFGPLFAGIHPSAVNAHLSVGHWRNELTQNARSAWSKYQVLVQVTAGLLVLVWWPRKELRRLWFGGLRRPKLVKRARDYSIHLKIERTSSWGGNLGITGVRGASLSLSKSMSDKFVPWSLPEMVTRLRGFIADMLQPAGGPVRAVVIGIDEIDRIGSVEQAERFIGEIKAIFGIPNCFFLVSVAEDVGFLFSRRSIVGQSALEHSFDDVIVVDPLDLDEARDLLSARVPGFTDSFVFLALALSGGLPREIIRVARRLIDVNRDLEAEDPLFPRIGDLATCLAAENMAEVLRTSRNQLARLSLPETWGDVLYKLRDAMIGLQSRAASLDERRKAVTGLCWLRSSLPADQAASAEADQVAAVKIISGIAAFARYSITVIEAFDNDYFDLHAARESMGDAAGGAYTELAAARLELGISPESSQSIIHRFRARSGLPPLT